MKRLPSAEDLPAHLDRQLIYLQNSVAAYYNCCVEETKRIGVAIRVRCHGNPPFFTDARSRTVMQPWPVAALGVMPPRAIFGRSYLYFNIHWVANI